MGSREKRIALMALDSNSNYCQNEDSNNNKAIIENHERNSNSTLNINDVFASETDTNIFTSSFIEQNCENISFEISDILHSSDLLVPVGNVVIEEVGCLNNETNSVAKSVRGEEVNEKLEYTITAGVPTDTRNIDSEEIIENLEEVTSAQEVDEENSVLEDNQLEHEKLPNNDEDIFCLDKSLTKSGEERKRKKFIKTKSDRKVFLRNQRIQKHAVKPPCNCKLKCVNNFSEDIRMEINNKYWSKNYIEQKVFLSTFVEKVPIKRRRPEILTDFRKNYGTNYFLKNSKGIRVKVCKKIFLTTLGYAANNDSILKKIGSPPNKDGRGSYKRLKIDRDLIKNHIKSFSPCLSHYRREHAPNKLYLSSDITITDMYNDFKKKYSSLSVSYDIYRRTVTKEMNISFTKLGHEECEKCEAFSLHDDEHKVETVEEHLDCSLCSKWKDHIEKAKRSREEYRKDCEMKENEDSTTIRYSSDMQKVIMLPRLEMFKQVIFTPRIIVLNQSFVPLAKIDSKNKPFAALWHEGVSGRKKEDIISAYHAFLTTYARDFDHVVIWADNCAGQNKNWTFFSYLVLVINSPELIAAKSITVKYFESGHTFMSADSFHHLVEQGLRKRKKVYDFQDFIEVVETCSKTPAVIKKMEYCDFKYWPNLTTTYQIQKLNNERPLLKNMVCVTVKRGQKCLFYQESFDLPAKELNFIAKKNINLNNRHVESHKENRGITEERKKNILKNLGPIMPEHKLSFWKNFTVNNNAHDLGQVIDDE